MRLLNFIVVFLLLNFTNCNSQNKTSENKISFKTLNKELTNKNLQLIDVRTAYEFKKGAIGNATNISILDLNFNKKIGQLNKEAPVYVYCQSGVRSAKACKKLRKFGFKFVYDYSGGYKEWSEIEK